jgi:hypothetical protein
MAKPSDTVKIWASTANHATGDYIGSATKVDAGAGVIQAGFVPGDVYAPTAEETNNELNIYSRYLAWLKDGKATADISAHVKETDADGNLFARMGDFTGDDLGAGEAALTGTATTFGMGVRGNGILTHGVYGEADGVGNAYGVYGNGVNNAGGVRGVGGTGALQGGYFTGALTGGGVRARGGLTSGYGVKGEGTGGQPDFYSVPTLNYGVDIACAADALGGIRVAANGQLGLYVWQDDPFLGAALFQGDSAASAAVVTLRAEAFAAGYAFTASNTAGTGYPIRVRPRAAAPEVGAILFDAQAARPTNTAAGQLTYLSEKQFAHSSPDDGGWRGFLSTIGGAAQGQVFSAAATLSGALNAWVNSVLMTSSGADAPKVSGQVMMRISLSARTNTANAGARLSLQLLDITAGGGVVWARELGNGFDLPNLGAAPLLGWTPMYFEIPVTVPLAGARSWRLQYATSLNSLLIRDVMIAFGPGML